jgi:hypothetical protein
MCGAGALARDCLQQMNSCGDSRLGCPLERSETQGAEKLTRVESEREGHDFSRAAKYREWTGL